MWYDLTWPIHTQLPLWPGDIKPEVLVDSSISSGDSSNTSIIRLPSHLGTHIDAPFHMESAGKTLDQLDLNVLIGPARIVDLTHLERAILPEDLQVLENDPAERVLLKTASGKRMEDPTFFPGYVALSVEAANFLVRKRIKLIGIDYLSIEPFRLPGHAVHHILFLHDVIVVEGLNLLHIPDGPIEMICLPLHVKNADGAPCRVVARHLN